MKESSEPLLKINEYSKSGRKPKPKAGTIKTKAFSLDLVHSKLKDSNKRKTEKKFIFKVYLHFFCQIIFIFLMTIISFRIKLINHFLSTNKAAFIIFSIIFFITFTYPLYTDKILRKSPYNYFYLIIFTISFSYLLCKMLIMLNPSLVRINILTH